MTAFLPSGLLAELTHRCPLQCAYCSNPLDLKKAADELPLAAWSRVFHEAAELGVLHLHLSGGEPAARRDLPEIVAAAHEAGLYTNLITSGFGLTHERLQRLRDQGLDHVQISLQSPQEAKSDIISGAPGSLAHKLNAARDTRALGMALTVNAPVHRGNLDDVSGFIELALSLDAGRIEIAHVQYYGWALANRAALMPRKADVLKTIELVEAARQRLSGRLVIDFVLPDYFADTPKPCMGGWGREVIVVTPAGEVWPCHAAGSLPGLQFENVKEKSLAEIWANGSAFNAFRGTDWMQEPCRSCARREIDYGGCRCQAMALAGDARGTDPVCALSPRHDIVAGLAAAEAEAPPPAYRYRRPGG